MPCLQAGRKDGGTLSKMQRYAATCSDMQRYAAICSDTRQRTHTPHTHAHACTRARTRTRTRTHTHAHARTRMHTHAHAHRKACARGGAGTWQVHVWVSSAGQGVQGGQVHVAQLITVLTQVRSHCWVPAATEVQLHHRADLQQEDSKFEHVYHARTQTLPAVS
jgi:hypothetical protein